jgi:hypothetical protein
MNDLGNHRQRAHRSRPDARNQKQAGKIGWARIGGGCEVPVKAPRDYVTRPDIVMSGHDEMGQRKLRRSHLVSLRWSQERQLVRDSVRPESAEQIELMTA